MAKDDQVNDEEETEKPKPKKKSGALKVVLLVFSALLLIGSSVGATLFFTGVLSKHDEVATADAVDGGGEADGKAATKSEGKKKKGKAAKESKEPKAPPVYVKLGDPFVVNFIEGNQIRYLQVAIEAMTRDSAVSDAINTHLPQIRNNLVLMFSGLDYQSLTSVEGKQKIREEALAEIQKILKEETGDEGVEAVYFTSFVMQ